MFIILADYYICRKVMKLAPDDFIEFRKEYLCKWNPCGVFSLLIAVAIGAAGVMGAYPMYYASFIAMIVGPILHVIATKMTEGRYYFSEFPQDVETSWKPHDTYQGPKPAVELS